MGPLKAKLRSLWMEEKGKAMTAHEKRVATIKRTIQAWESIKDTTVRKVVNKALNTTCILSVAVQIGQGLAAMPSLSYVLREMPLSTVPQAQERPLS
ncbi:hypothetical protein F443_02497 [Phytophthora nicotianae P1569]|uniref:DDE-1 domain-containing protein n=2 Tax=Phytophthora nicotianae TaxID=4792 RepID=V9FVE2_PHYNI|nr:hypothetical protein F443_02497 [Phytophthora nicotianae P1569]